MTQTIFDPSRYKWRKVTGEPGGSYEIHHDYTILGHDAAAGTLDMLVRWYGDGGHCPVHRHASVTTVLVLEGEQHLTDLLPGGETRAKVRRAGEHHLTPGDVHPHMERGGPDGALIFYGHHTTDGRMYELLDDDLEVVHTVTLDEMIETWENA